MLFDEEEDLPLPLGEAAAGDLCLLVLTRR